jgi:hypothetical protein
MKKPCPEKKRGVVTIPTSWHGNAQPAVTQRPLSPCQAMRLHAQRLHSRVAKGPVAARHCPRARLQRAPNPSPAHLLLAVALAEQRRAADGVLVQRAAQLHHCARGGAGVHEADRAVHGGGLPRARQRHAVLLGVSLAGGHAPQLRRRGGRGEGMGLFWIFTAQRLVGPIIWKCSPSVGPSGAMRNPSCPVRWGAGPGAGARAFVMVLQCSAQVQAGALLHLAPTMFVWQGQAGLTSTRCPHMHSQHLPIAAWGNAGPREGWRAGAACKVPSRSQSTQLVRGYRSEQFDSSSREGMG